MKTPMQLMHDFLCAELEKKQPWEDYPRIEDAILKCEELMKLEQDVIEEAFEEGHIVAVEHGCPMSFVIPGSFYYDETFNTTDK